MKSRLLCHVPLYYPSLNLFCCAFHLMESIQPRGLSFKQTCEPGIYVSGLMTKRATPADGEAVVLV